MEHDRVKTHPVLICAVLCCVGVGQPVLAHSIDGTWCSADGRKLHIAGPLITTPEGHEIAGTHRQHSFSYRMPPGVPGAGRVTSMTLSNDDVLKVTPPSSTNVTIGSSVQHWRRCAAIS